MLKSSLIRSCFSIMVVIFMLAVPTLPLLAQSDADGDGISDSSDACPRQGNEGGLGVDADGCPIYDADRDGVVDRNDNCPWRADEYGYGIGADGCPLTAAPTDDAPQEQTPNPTATNPTEVTNDPAPPTNNPPSTDATSEPPADNTPEAEMQTEEAATTETAEPPYGDRDEMRDADGDGFADIEDSCPWRGNEGGLGVDETGCPYYDADWDGVFDRDDNCPWRANEYGFGIDDDGCPLDNDDDEVVEDSIYERLIELTDTTLADWQSAATDTLGNGTRTDLIAALEAAFEQLANSDLSLSTRQILAYAIIYDNWTIDDLDALNNNYIPRLSNLGYPITDINNIVNTVGRNQPYQLGAADYSYLLEDLDRMISELEGVYLGNHPSTSNTVQLFELDLIEDNLPHLPIPNPLNQNVIFLTHGWSVDGVIDSDVDHNGEVITQNDYRHTADWYAEQYAGVPSDQLPILVGVNWDADYADVEPAAEELERVWLERLLPFGNVVGDFIRSVANALLTSEETIELSDIVYYNEIEDRARSAGEHLGYYIEHLQENDPIAPVSIVSHSMGNHVALQALEFGDLDIANYVIIQAPVGAYDDDTGLIDGRYDDVLTDEVGEIFVTYSFTDIAMALYEKHPPFPLIVSPLGALGARGLWEGFVYSGLNVVYQEFAQVSNFLTFLGDDEVEIADAHQSINLHHVWDSVQDFVYNIFSNLLTL